MLEHARFADTRLEGGEVAAIEDAQHPRSVQFDPAGGLTHRRQCRAAGLDGHRPPVRGFHRSIAAARLNVVEIRADSARDCNELRQRFLVHGGGYSQSMTALIPCPASTTA